MCTPDGIHITFPAQSEENHDGVVFARQRTSARSEANVVLDQTYTTRVSVVSTLGTMGAMGSGTNGAPNNIVFATPLYHEVRC